MIDYDTDAFDAYGVVSSGFAEGNPLDADHNPIYSHRKILRRGVLCYCIRPNQYRRSHYDGGKSI